MSRRASSALATLALAGLALVAACSDDPTPPEDPRVDASGSGAAVGGTHPPPPWVTEPLPPPPRTTLTVVGDLMLVRGVPDPAAALAPLRDRLAGADITVGNLESTLSTDGEPTQVPVTDSFGGSPALVPVLRDAGFDALSLGNNHTGDYGPRAFLATLDAVRGSPIVPFGAGRGLDEASRPAIIRRDGVRFAFIAFNAIGETPSAAPGSAGALSVRMPPRTGPLAEADLRHVESVVRRAGRQADAVVVLPHWGDQYTPAPLEVQRAVARRLVAAGADLVVGGHPHWVQTSDVVRGVPVIYSLGNFVFDQDFQTRTMEGVFLETTWRGGTLVDVTPVPYRLDPVSFAPRVVRGEAAAEVLGTLSLPAAAPRASSP